MTPRLSNFSLISNNSKARHEPYPFYRVYHDFRRPHLSFSLLSTWGIHGGEGEGEGTKRKESTTS